MKTLSRTQKTVITYVGGIMHLRKLCTLILCISCWMMTAHGQDGKAAIQFDAHTKVFRLDGGAVSYIFGVNEQGALQPIYWGARLGASDALPPPHTNEGNASFDLPIGTTPQEYAGWGAGLYVEPALKVTFADGNRDLVLRYASHQIDASVLTVTLKDIQRDVFVV